MIRPTFDDFPAFLNIFFLSGLFFNIYTTNRRSISEMRSSNSRLLIDNVEQNEWIFTFLFFFVFDCQRLFMDQV